jgi:hypothetical protein
MVCMQFLSVEHHHRTVKSWAGGSWVLEAGGRWRMWMDIPIQMQWLVEADRVNSLTAAAAAANLINSS